MVVSSIMMVRHRWPGNVRELRHTLERACILGEGTRLALDLDRVDAPATDLTQQSVTKGGLKSRTQAEERALILAALNQHDYHMTATAQASGYRNVEFRLGEIENLPLGDATVDAVISNCVINRTGRLHARNRGR